MAMDDQTDQAPKAPTKKTQAATDPPRDDRSYLKPGEEHLPEITQAEIIMGRKTLEMNNPKMLAVERMQAEELEKQPKNLVLQRSDPRFQSEPQSNLKNPPVQATRPTSMTR